MYLEIINPHHIIPYYHYTTTPQYQYQFILLHQCFIIFGVRSCWNREDLFQICSHKDREAACGRNTMK